MNRVKVKSSFIDSIGHDGDTLEVVYKDGKIYRYAGIPVDLYQSVIGAESIGKALKEQVLKGGLEVERVEPETGESE